MRVIIFDDENKNAERVKKALANYGAEKQIELDVTIQSAEASVAKSIVFSCVEGNIRIPLSEILYFETVGHRISIHLVKREYHTYEKMKNLTERFSEAGFIRVHQSFLVNMKHIRNLNNYMITLDNGKEIPVPKTRYREVKQEYTRYTEL